MEMEKIEDQNSNTLSSNESTADGFWGAFDKDTQSASNQELTSIDSEIRRWSGVSPLSRSTIPLHAMEGLKREYPRIYALFRKYCVFPSTQNRDERIFSIVSVSL